MCSFGPHVPIMVNHAYKTAQLEVNGKYILVNTRVVTTWTTPVRLNSDRNKITPNISQSRQKSVDITGSGCGVIEEVSLLNQKLKRGKYRLAKR